MGLDLFVSRIDYENGHARWAYSGFMRFRERLARSIGVELRQMDGFGPPYRTWDEVNDPIVPLLDHSDCDGQLDYDACEKVESRLRELVDDWPDDDYDKQQALALADLMAEVVSGEAQAVEFR